MQEIWKDIENYECYYQASTNGEVKSLDRYDSMGRLWKSGTLKPFPIKDGYLGVKLSKNGKKTPPIQLGILIYETFIGPIPEGCEIHHINHNRQDNRLENLCLIDASKHKSMHLTERNVKDKSKPILRFNKDMELICEYPSISEASRQTGISITSIHNCLTGRSKTSGGSVWKYK